jgi:hypothetical protein
MNPALQHYREPGCPLGHPATVRGLLRQYLPKKSDLSEHSQAELNKIALWLFLRASKPLPTRHFYFAENPTFLTWFDIASQGAVLDGGDPGGDGIARASEPGLVLQKM